MNDLVEHTERAYPVAMVCERVGMSRQNYYAARRYRQRRQIDEELVVQLVREERKLQPRMGGRKLLFKIGSALEDAGVEMGRDRFFEVLAEHDLLVLPKPGAPRTTNSRHSLPVFENRVKNLTVTGINQAWVADLTYIRTGEGFVFGAILMDRYSRKIVGAYVGDSLETETCLKALEEALEDLPEGQYPIHHSDRGCQYCSHLYVANLQQRHLPISMTQEMHCYENAHAERVIGTLKQEYGLDAEFKTKIQAYEAFRQAIILYNCHRPHTALGYKTPNELHQQAA